MITIKSATAKILLGTAGAAALLLGGLQTASANTIKVQAGDTVWGFSQTYHVSIQDIVKANSLADANLIYIDQKLEIPANSQTTAKAANNTGASTTANRAGQSSSATATTKSTTNQASSAAASSQITQDQTRTSASQASSSSATQTSQAQSNSTYTHNSPNASSQTRQSNQTTSKSTTPSSGTSQANRNTSSTAGGGVAEALSIAKSGVPYVYGGSSMSGFDCSGLVQHVFGLSARTTYQQTKLGTHHYDVANAPYGAILFWGSDSAPYHDGISLGNGTYVAAQNENDGIGVFSQSNWKPSYYITLN